MVKNGLIIIIIIQKQTNCLTQTLNYTFSPNLNTPKNGLLRCPRMLVSHFKKILIQFL